LKAEKEKIKATWSAIVKKRYPKGSTAMGCTTFCNVI